MRFHLLEVRERADRNEGTGSLPWRPLRMGEISHDRVSILLFHVRDRCLSSRAIFLISNHLAHKRVENPEHSVCQVSFRTSGMNQERKAVLWIVQSALCALIGTFLFDYLWPKMGWPDTPLRYVPNNSNACLKLRLEYFGKLGWETSQQYGYLQIRTSSCYCCCGYSDGLFRNIG